MEMLHGEKRHLGVFLIILLLIGTYFFLVREDSPREMGEQNRYELRVLNGLIKKKQFFRDSLKNHMDSVMLQLHKHTDYSDEFRYYTNRQMLLKSQMFSYDYASQFSHKMRLLSDQIGDGNLKAESRILSSFNMAQACLFVEALDMLKSVDLDFPNLNDSILALYYFYYGITYQRLAVYVNDSINAKKYNNTGIELFMKSLDYSKDQGMNNFVLGRVYGRQEKYDVAQKHFEEALKYIKKDDNILYTLANASLGKCFKHQGIHEPATRYYIEATKNDILNAQNSSIAIIDLTEHLYKQYHQTRDVIKYVNLAIENGEYYGMRSQITHIDQIIPDISKERARHNRLLVIFTVAIVAVFIIYILHILFRYEKNRKLLKDYLSMNEQVKEENNLLHEENEKLSRAGMLLRDSNKLKDAYLGKLLESNSELTNMFEEFAIKADQKLKKAQYEQVQKSIKELQKNFSKKEQLDRFDELFMSMFPTFITDFNALLMPEHRKQESEALLTPSMRIFALIRLGITSNQQIARVLNYTYNTILNYRVRVRAMAINPDTFEQDIIKIGL
jgi:tetratricopeptide (TPR) repeat protein